MGPAIPLQAAIAINETPLKKFYLVITLFFFASLQDVKLNGNKLSRVPTEALRGPESLQNLQLQDNFIGKSYYKCLNCNVKNLNTLGAKIQNRIFLVNWFGTWENFFFQSKRKFRLGAKRLVFSFSHQFLMMDEFNDKFQTSLFDFVLFFVPIGFR